MLELWSFPTLLSIILCTGVWIHTPPCPLSALPNFFLRDANLTLAGTLSAHENATAIATSAGIRDFGVTIICLSSGSCTRSTFSLHLQHFQGARPYTHAFTQCLPYPGRGIATCSTRANHMTGLSPVRLWSCRPPSCV